MVTFNATASAPISLAYHWAFGDGGTANGVLSPNHVYANPGTYTATLTASDGYGLSGASSVQVEVHDVAPALSVTGPTSAPVQNSVSFTASASSSSPAVEAAGFQYSWQFGDGSTANGPSPSHTYSQDGNYTVGVTATDAYGLSTTRTTSVVISPVAIAGSDLTAVSGTPVSFQGEAIGQHLGYHWDFGDHTTADGTLTPAHTYDSGGYYTATLTVTDPQGLSSQSSLVVTVDGPSVTINAPSQLNTSLPVYLYAVTTDPSTVDLWSGFTYNWNFGDGTTGSGKAPAHTFAAAGNYTVSVTATDQHGVASAATTSLTINAPDVIPIDSAWLNSHTAPYQLTQANTTYVLQTDVTTSGGAFVDVANNVILDLNGHTVTYDNAAPITVTNGGFESGDFTGWNVSAMPDVSITGPVILGFWGNDYARFSVPASASPVKETMISNSIAIPTSGIPYEGVITVKGTNQTVVTLSVVDATTGAVLGTNTINPNILSGGPPIYVQFTPANTDPVQLKLDITPSANTATEIDMDYANVSRSRVYGVDFGWNKSNFRATSSTTSGSGATAGAMTITDGVITGIAVANAGSGYTTPPTVIITSGSGAASGLDATAHAVISGGRVTGFVIDNGGSAYTSAMVYVLSGGRIVQGTGNSVRSNAINDSESVNGITIDNIGISVTGRDSCNIYTTISPNVTVRNCTLLAGLNQISNRMAALGMMSLNSVKGVVDVENNVLEGTHQNGIVVNGYTDYLTSLKSITIAYNSIAQNSSWTDGYGIGIERVHDFEIAYNTIHPVSGRGIIVQAGVLANSNDLNGTIHDNDVVVRERGNLEYGQLGLIAVALRMRNYTGTFGNIEIINNIFAAYTGEWVGEDMSCAGGRLTLINNNGQMTGANLVFKNNDFKAIIVNKDPTLPAAQAWGLSFAQVDANTGVTYINNTCESNVIPLNFGDSDGINESDITMVGTTLVKSTEGDQTFTYHTMNVGGWGSSTHNIRLIDTTYQNGASAVPFFVSTGAKDISFGYSLTVNVVDSTGNPVSGAAVSIFDSSGNMLYGGATDANGWLGLVSLITTTYSVPQNGNDSNPTVTTTQSFTVKAKAGSRLGTRGIVLTGDQTVQVVVS